MMHNNTLNNFINGGNLNVFLFPEASHRAYIRIFLGKKQLKHLKLKGKFTKSLTGKSKGIFLDSGSSTLQSSNNFPICVSLWPLLFSVCDLDILCFRGIFSLCLGAMGHC